jgi:hypothetical protein
MAAMEDVVKNNLPIVLGLGLTFAVPVVFPSLRPQWAAAIKTGLKIYLEAGAEVESDLVDSLAEAAVDQLAAAIARPADDHESKVAKVVSTYKAKARSRAERWGRSEEGRRKRYDRHIAKLRHEISRRRDAEPGDRDAAWAMALEKIA